MSAPRWAELLEQAYAWGEASVALAQTAVVVMEAELGPGPGPPEEGALALDEADSRARWEVLYKAIACGKDGVALAETALARMAGALWTGPGPPEEGATACEAADSRARWEVLYEQAIAQFNADDREALADTLRVMHKLPYPPEIMAMTEEMHTWALMELASCRDRIQALQDTLEAYQGEETREQDRAEARAHAAEAALQARLWRAVRNMYDRQN